MWFVSLCAVYSFSPALFGSLCRPLWAQAAVAVGETYETVASTFVVRLYHACWAYLPNDDWATSSKYSCTQYKIIYTYMLMCVPESAW